MAESIPPLRIREADGSPNVIPVFDIQLSGGTLTSLGAGKVLITVDSGGGASGSPNPTLPVLVASGGTGTTTHTAYGLLYGSGANPIQALAPMSAGSLVVGSGITTRPHILGSGATGQMLVSSAGLVGGLYWANTLGGASAAVYAATGNQYLTVALAADLTADRRLQAGTGLYATDLGADNDFLLSNSARSIRMPMALLTVQPDSANAFWTANTLPLLDVGHVCFVDSGEGIATYWTTVPFNVHPDPNWTIVAYHMPDAGAGGNAIVSLKATAVTHAETAAFVRISSAHSFATQATTALAIAVATLGVGVFDAVVPVSAGDLVFVEVTRHGGNADDTVGAQWNLYTLAFQCNVL